MAYTLILGTGRKDIIDVYKAEMSIGVLFRSETSPTLNQTYNANALRPLTTPLRLRELMFTNNDNEYQVSNDLQTQFDNNIFLQFVPYGIGANKIGLLKPESGSTYRLNGLINITEIAPSVDTPVLINLNIKIIDNL